MTDREMEVSAIAKLNDFKLLDLASNIEHILQSQVKTDLGKIRVRKTIDRVGNISYTETIKLPIKSNTAHSCIEDTINITKERFNNFLAICPSYSKKVRFSFPINKVKLKTPQHDEQTLPIDGIYFEVDVFYDPENNTNFYPYCRIEVEIQKIYSYIKANYPNIEDYDVNIVIDGKLPFKPTDVFFEHKATEEQNKILDYLHQKVITTHKRE